MTRYRMTKRNHPLRPECGRTYLHRVLLYDTIGPGSHPCHYCGTIVEWRVGEHTEEGALITEHVDGDIENNDISNLVPSCQRCNLKKNRRAVGDDEIFVVKKGKRYRAVERTCLGCGSTFRTPVSNLSKKGGGRYCSMSCVYQRGRE